MSEVRYIRGSDLDRQRWDALMRTAPNADLFGSSIFLDTMTDGWDALVCGDYEAVLPLPLRQRFGIRYIYILPFCGPFSVYGRLPEGVLVETMLDAIPKSRVRCDINLWTDTKPSGWKALSRSNHLLDLSEGYASIRSRYHATARNLLNREIDAGLQLITAHPISSQTQMARLSGTLGKTSRKDILRFESLCERWPESGELLSLAISTSGGEVRAGGVFLRSHQRLHYLLGWSDPEGRKVNASRLILDHVIRMYAGQSLTLDLEGSDIPGVAQFFESFGAIPYRYQFLRRDHLPALLRHALKLRDRLSKGA